MSVHHSDVEDRLRADSAPEVRYSRTGTLGEGGMGEVRLCTDVRLEREVAMKVVRAEHLRRSDLIGRFLDEARIQGWLEHPAVAPVYDLGADREGAPYFTMRRVRGTTLERILAGLRARDDGYADYTRHKLLAAFGRVCLAVHYAHERGVLHRDLKPSNVMLGSYGEVYVLDWGLAKVAAQGDPAASPRRTDPNAILGTPGYMAPELASGDLDAVDTRTDVYALGAILFEILALEPLHNQATQMGVVRSTLLGIDARPSLRAPQTRIPAELDSICVRATALDPGARFRTARELYDALDRFLEADRDLEQRRALAAEHAARAESAAERALDEVDPRAPARREALQEASRALAFAPSNVSALETLRRLLASPPRVLPSDVERELRAVMRRVFAKTARGGALLQLSWFLYFPFGLALGFRDIRWYVTVSVLLTAGAAQNYWRSRRPPAEGEVPYAGILMTSLAIGSLSTLWGPFILVPLLAITMLTMLIMLERGLVVCTLAACATVVLPVALDWLGVIPPFFSFDGHSMFVEPKMLHMPRTATLAVCTAVHMLFLVSVGVSFIHLRGTLDEAERRLHLHAWQLRQLVPADPEKAVTSLSAVPVAGRCASAGSLALTRLDPRIHEGTLVALEEDGGPGSRYEVEATLGAEGVGERSLCRDRRIGREVVMKVLRASSNRRESREPFLREAIVQARLEHPSIAAVYDAGLNADGDPYFTMKPLRGTTLADALADLRGGEPRGVHRSTHELLDAFSTACLAVEYAHAVGVVHGRLESTSVVLGDYGDVYVADWGTSARAPSEEAADARLDVERLGVILREIVTTVPVAGPPERDVAPELEAIYLKATAPRVDERYATASELAQAVERFLEGERDTARRRVRAEEHVAAAATAAERAFRGGPSGIEARARTMREVSRALALDPLNEKATGLLMRLFTEPPGDLPDDAAREMNEAGRADQRRAARSAAMLYLTWFLYLPLGMYQGIRDARLYVLISLAFLAAVLAFARVARSRRVSGEEYATVAGAMLAAASLAAIAGSFVIVPALVLANMAGFLLQIGRARRWLVIVLGCLAVVGPLALESVGLIPPAYAFHDDRLDILPRLLELPKGVSLGVLSGVHVMLIVTASIFFARFRGSLSRAEEAVHINAWQLRQLVPREARAAVTDPRSGS